MPAHLPALRRRAFPPGHGHRWCRTKEIAAAAGTRHPDTGDPHSPQLLAQLTGPPQAGALVGAGAVAPMTSAPMTSAPMTSGAVRGAVPGTVQGVDVASFQHPKTSKYPHGTPVNWAAVAAAGIRFARSRLPRVTTTRTPTR